jgi:hypothetical protein
LLVVGLPGDKALPASEDEGGAPEAAGASGFGRPLLSCLPASCSCAC